MSNATTYITRKVGHVTISFRAALAPVRHTAKHGFGVDKAEHTWPVELGVTDANDTQATSYMSRMEAAALLQLLAQALADT